MNVFEHLLHARLRVGPFAQGDVDSKGTSLSYSLQTLPQGRGRVSCAHTDTSPAQALGLPAVPACSACLISLANLCCVLARTVKSVSPKGSMPQMEPVSCRWYVACQMKTLQPVIQGHRG